MHLCIQEREDFHTIKAVLTGTIIDSDGDGGGVGAGVGAGGSGDGDGDGDSVE